jgi:hypothetical protein
VVTGSGVAISRGASIGGGAGGTAAIVVAGVIAVGDTVAASDITGGDGRTGGTGVAGLAAALVDAVPDFAGGMVASAFSARSNTVAAVSPRAADGGEAAGEVFTTSLDCRDDFAGSDAGAMDNAGPSALPLFTAPEALAAFEGSTGACTAAGVAAGFTSD